MVCTKVACGNLCRLVVFLWHLQSEFGCRFEDVSRSRRSEWVDGWYNSSNDDLD